MHASPRLVARPRVLLSLTSWARRCPSLTLTALPPRPPSSTLCLRCSPCFSRSQPAFWPLPVRRAFSSLSPPPPSSGAPLYSGPPRALPMSDFSGQTWIPPSFSSSDSLNDRNRRLLKYAAAVAIFFLGASYAAVPLYRIFCQRTGYGGTTQRVTDYSALGTGVSEREFEVTFMADTAPDLHWSFTPSQPKVRVKAGEPVLAFYKATNNRDRPVTGVATYNVTPMKTGFYFHKIQCFCFDEQRLRAKETVDMPVFFYIDPAISKDRRCNDVTHLTLSYTFFALRSDEEEEEEERAATGLLTALTPPTGAVVQAA